MMPAKTFYPTPATYQILTDPATWEDRFTPEYRQVLVRPDGSELYYVDGQWVEDPRSQREKDIAEAMAEIEAFLAQDQYAGLEGGK